MNPSLEETTETEPLEETVSTATPSPQPRTRKGAIELHLKNLLMQDMALRHTIKNAKTTAKKKFFEKKLKKITVEAKKMIAALRRLEGSNG